MGESMVVASTNLSLQPELKIRNARGRSSSQRVRLRFTPWRSTSTRIRLLILLHQKMILLCGPWML